MTLVEEIEAAITSLPPEDLARLAEWFRAREEDRWDAQLDRDSAEGKLNFLFEEAERELASDLVRPWPPAE